METRKNLAVELKQDGKHNCAQAVLHAYADLSGLDAETCMNLAGPVCKDKA